MAYETGSATGVVDLLNKLATFIEANGWTRDALADEASGRRYHAHRGTDYFNARAYVAEVANAEIYSRTASAISSLAFNLGTGYSAGVAWYKQAGVPPHGTQYQTAGVSAIAGAISAYHFFAHSGGDQIFAVVEYTSGKYQWFGFGKAVKIGTYTGGTYFFGSHYGVGTTPQPGFGFFSPGSISNSVQSYANAAYFTIDVDGETGWHRSGVTFAPTTARIVSDVHQPRHLFAIFGQPNTLNDQSVLLPVIPFVRRSTTLQTVSPIGRIPGLFYCNLEKLVPGQQITQGSTNYRVFPWVAKGSSATNLSESGDRFSGYFGFAVQE